MGGGDVVHNGIELTIVLLKGVSSLQGIVQHDPLVTGSAASHSCSLKRGCRTPHWSLRHPKGWECGIPSKQTFDAPIANQNTALALIVARQPLVASSAFLWVSVGYQTSPYPSLLINCEWLDKVSGLFPTDQFGWKGWCILTLGKDSAPVQEWISHNLQSSEKKRNLLQASSLWRISCRSWSHWGW